MPAYSITEVETVDEELAEQYVRLARAAVMRHGGRYLARGATPIIAEGEWRAGRRLVIIEFSSMERLKAWYDSEEYAPARALAARALRRRLLFVDGFAGQQDAA